MSDVFVSYARQDEAQAERIAHALRGDGYRVWRDDELPAHRAYAEVIEERLKSAKAVVVLWSADAVKSQWVRAEADTARSAGTLVQALLDGTIPPLPFNQIQCADLTGWDGDPSHRGWSKLNASVRELAGDSKPKESKGRSAQRKISICVLPFQNMSGDAEQEYFSDGISEDITTDLSRISALEVISRNSAFTYKGKSVNVCEVAQELQVTHVLEGSVRKAGDRVRITAQLIDGASGGHVWAERYDRDLTDIFAIQDEISESIVAALKLKLLPEEKKAIEQRGTTNVEAYKLYLLARQYWITGNHGDIRREERVMRICGRAVEIDPYYAQAWALLALAQSNLCYGFGCEVDDGFAAAHAALAIDPYIAEAYCPMVRRLKERGRHSDADAEIEKALRLDPDSWEVNKEAARLAMDKRDLLKAARHFEKAVEMMDTDFHAWDMLVTCYCALNQPEEARSAAQMALSQADKALAVDPSNGAALAIAASALVFLGDRDRADERMERALLLDPDNLNMRYNFGCALAHSGDADEAVRMLGPVFLRCSRVMVDVAQRDPDLDSLRDDPRFQKMLASAQKRLKIDAAATATAS